MGAVSRRRTLAIGEVRAHDLTTSLPPPKFTTLHIYQCEDLAFFQKLTGNNSESS